MFHFIVVFFALQWEPSVLEKLHDSLQRIVLDKVFGKLKGMVKGEILKVTYYIYM